MIDKDKAVQGVGVYAEFARNGATTQIIVVPDGYTQSGDLVPANIIRRVVTESTPKKQWRFSRLPNAKVSAAEVTNDVMAEERVRYATSLFDQLLGGGWVMVKSPVLLEVSRKDYDSIAMNKTPTKLIYRIAQSRTALDFPANLINTAV